MRCRFGDEIRFNLMAIVTDRKTTFIKRLEELANVSCLNQHFPATFRISKSSGKSKSPFLLSGMESETVAAEMAELQTLIEEEEQKATRQRVENIRRWAGTFEFSNLAPPAGV